MSAVEYSVDGDLVTQTRMLPNNSINHKFIMMLQKIVIKVGP